MDSIQKQEKIFIWATLLLLAIAMVFNIGKFPFMLEEQRRALIALEMDYNENLIVPTQIGDFYYRKPPLFNWALIAAWKISGSPSETAARMVTVISLLLTGLIHFLFFKRWHSWKLGLYSALLYIISADLFFSFAFFAEIDVFYSLISYSSILAAIHFYRLEKKLPLFLLLYGLSAIGALTKGLSSFPIPPLTLLALCLPLKDWKTLISWQHVAGISLMIIIIGSWLLAYTQYNSLETYFSELWGESANRTPIGHGGGELVKHFFTFPGIVLMNIIPASLFLPLLFVPNGFKGLWKHDLFRMVLIVFLANILLYWVSPGTRSRYLYPFTPLLVVLFTELYLRYQNTYPLIDKLLNILILIGGCGITVGGGVLLMIKEVQIIPYIQLWTIVLVMMGIAFVVIYLRLKKPVILWLTLMVVVGRIAFDLTVLPARALVGVHVEVRDEGVKLAEITSGENLRMFRFAGSGNFPFGTAFAYNRASGKVLKNFPEPNCEEYFVSRKEQLVGFDYQEFYQFEIGEQKFKVVKFTDCKGDSILKD